MTHPDEHAQKRSSLHRPPLVPSEPSLAKRRPRPGGEEGWREGGGSFPFSGAQGSSYFTKRWVPSSGLSLGKGTPEREEQLLGYAQVHFNRPTSHTCSPGGDVYADFMQRCMQGMP